MSKQQSPVSSFPLEHIQRIIEFIGDKSLEDGPYSMDLEEAEQVSMGITIRLQQPNEVNTYVVYGLAWSDEAESWIISLHEEVER